MPPRCWRSPDRAAVMFNKSWLQEDGEDSMFTDITVDTGSFTWDEGQSVGVDEQNLTKNPDYFKDGLPNVDKVTIFGILDESAQQASMLARQTDWTGLATGANTTPTPNTTRYKPLSEPPADTIPCG